MKLDDITVSINIDNAEEVKATLDDVQKKADALYDTLAKIGIGGRYRKRGKWILSGHADKWAATGLAVHKCSECGNEITEYTERYNYCPYCGAEMRVIQ